MLLLSLAIGVVIGLLLNPAKEKVKTFITPGDLTFSQEQSKYAETQFFEPVSDKEKFNQAKNISDVL